MATIQMFLLPGGQLQLLVDGDGLSFDEAEAATQQILAYLQADGVAITLVSDIEQHRDSGMSHVHLEVSHREHP